MYRIQVQADPREGRDNRQENATPGSEERGQLLASQQG